MNDDTELTHVETTGENEIRVNGQRYVKKSNPTSVLMCSRQVGKSGDVSVHGVKYVREDKITDKSLEFSTRWKRGLTDIFDLIEKEYGDVIDREKVKSLYESYQSKFIKTEL